MKGHFHARPVLHGFLPEDKRIGMDGARARHLHLVRKEFLDTPFVMEFMPLSGYLIPERNAQGPIEIGLCLQILPYQRPVKIHRFEDIRVGAEEDAGTRTPGRGGHLLELCNRLSTFVALLPGGPVPFDRGHQLLGKGIHHGRPNAVQTARGDVVGTVEFTPGMQRGQNDLDGGQLLDGVLVHWYPAAIVRDRDRATILVQRHIDLGGIPVRGLVDGVVDNLPQQVVQPRFAGPADIHARPLSNGLEPFEDLDILAGIRFAHRNPSAQSDMPSVISTTG